MNWTTRFQNVDRRVIYLLLLIFCVWPLIRPMGIPLQISPMTEAVFKIIEKLDPTRDTVLLSFDYSPGTGLDAHVVPVAIVEHLVARGIKWVAVSFAPEGPLMCDRLIAGSGLEKRGLRYGIDFVNLGYMAGDENAVRLFALDCTIIPTDTRGNKTVDLPIMLGKKTVKDFGFVMQFNAGGPEIWVRQVVDPMKIVYALGTVTVSVPSALPYYDSGQIKGLLGGLRASAEYELLNGKPGQGASMMDAQSMAHLLILGFIALGNIAYFASKKKNTGRTG